MSKSNIELIKKLRDETNVSVAMVNKALIEAGGDYNNAKKLLTEWGAAVAQKKADSDAPDGIVQSYIHHNNRMGAMVVLHCQTDFVAKNDAFIALAHDIAMQIASMQPKNTEELLAQQFIKDTSRTIGDLVKETIVKVGENIKIGDFVRFAIGE